MLAFGHGLSYTSFGTQVTGGHTVHASQRYHGRLQRVDVLQPDMIAARRIAKVVAGIRSGSINPARLGG